MDFALSEEQQAIFDMAHDFAQHAIAPHALAWDEQAILPREVLEAAAELGLASIYVPEEHGGSGLNRLEASLIFEALAMACPTVSAFLSIHNMISWMVSSFGDEAVRERYLADLCSMKKIGAYCLTEPGSGSDAAALKTSAKPDGDDYIINGQKVFTSGMDISDYCLLVTRTSRGEKQQEGITLFLVDTKLPGIDIKKIDTLGHRGIGTTQVFYEDVRVPKTAIMGELDQGWRCTDQYLWYERLCLSAARYGAASAAFEHALNYAKEREQFGRPIGKFQAISHKLADMRVMLEVSHLLVYQFAWKMERGEASRHDAAIIKLYSGEAYKAISDLGLQIFGGYGFCMEYPMQRFFRDSRLAVIGGGTSEIQRNIIAKSLGL